MGEYIRKTQSSPTCQDEMTYHIPFYILITKKPTQYTVTVDDSLRFVGIPKIAVMLLCGRHRNKTHSHVYVIE